MLSFWIDISCDLVFQNYASLSKKNPNSRYFISFCFETLLFVIFSLSRDFFSINFHKFSITLSATFDERPRIIHSARHSYSRFPIFEICHNFTHKKFPYQEYNFLILHITSVINLSWLTLSKIFFQVNINYQLIPIIHIFQCLNYCHFATPVCSKLIAVITE